MYLERHWVAWVLRVIPGPGFQFDHAGPEIFRKRNTGQARAAVVEQADDVAIHDVSFSRIAQVHPGRRPSPDLGVAAGDTVVVLAVQAGFRLIGDQVQRIAPRPGRPQPLLSVVPPGMAGAVVVVETGDFLRIQLDPAGGRAQGVSRRIGTELLQRENAVLELVVYRQLPAVPEFIKIRQGNVGAGCRFPCLVVKIFHPSHLIPALGKFPFSAQPFCQSAENIVVVS